MRLRTLFLLLVCCTNVIAQTKNTISFQDFQKEFNDLLAHQPKNYYSVGIDFSYYDSKEQKQIIQNEGSQLKVLNGNHYVYKSGTTIQIQEGGIRLDIDTSLRRVLVSKAKLEGFNMTSDNLFQNIDSNNYMISKTSSKDRLIYEINELTESSNYQTISFIFDNKSKSFTGLELLLWAANYTSERIDDQSKEQPFLKYSYSEFKNIKESELKNDELVSSWILENELGKLVSKKLDYQLHDLR